MPAKDRQKDFGRYLQKHRMDKGISLEAISRVTRISMTSLRQIENEDCENLPAPVFVKGFLRAYADAVDIDAGPALERYDACLDVQSDTRHEFIEQKRGKSFVPRALIALLLLIVTVALTVIAYKIWYMPQTTDIQEPTEPTGPSEPSKPSESSGSEQKQTPTDTAVPSTNEAREKTAENGPTDKTVSDTTAPVNETVQPEEPVPAVEIAETTPEVPGTPPPTAEAVPAQEPAEPVAQKSAEGKPGLQLRLKAVEETWLKITADEKSPKEYIMKAGEEKIVTADVAFNVLIGNAGGLEVWFNDEPVALSGVSGKVIRLKLP